MIYFFIALTPHPLILDVIRAFTALAVNNMNGETDMI